MSRALHLPTGTACLSIAVLLGSTIRGAEPPSGLDGAAEVRAIWVTRWDYRSEADVRRAVRGAASLGLNRVLFQVRGRADAFYRSDLEPWGEEIGGRDPGFDPLQVALEEAARSHIALDAWVNVMPGWKGSKPPRSRDHLVYRRPEWFLTDQTGKRHLLEQNRYTILNPCLPEVRSYLVAIVKDIATRYPIAGLHLDYARFVGRDRDGVDFPYDARTMQLFHKHAGTVPSRGPEAWDRWRLASVNTVVYRIAKAFREIRPGARVSVAAIKDYQRARKWLFQDVATWQSRGWIDEVFPMTYDKVGAVFARSVNAVLAQGIPHSVYPGIGVYLLDTPAQLSAQIDWTRRTGAGGYALFALSNFFRTPSHESSQDARSRDLRAQMRRTLQSLNDPVLSSARAPRRREQP